MRQQSTKNRSEKLRRRKQIRIRNLQISLSTILIIFFAIMGIALAYIFKVILTSPEINAATVAPQGYTTFIYDESGKQVDKLHDHSSNREYRELNQIPQAMQDSVIVMEDIRFYSHNGIDLFSLTRAICIDIITMSKKQGASTLTQQLIKNNVLTSDKKFERKVREMYLATVLESKLKSEYGKKEAKDVILELYLNTVGFGKGCYGVQAAATRYFGKDASELTLDECTILGAIIQSPTHLEPVGNPESNNERRKIILKYLLKYDKITKEEYQASMDANPYVGITEHNAAYEAENEANSYFVDTLIEEVTADLVKQKGLTENTATNLIYSGGLKIYSTMDPKVQGAIDEVFKGPNSTFATNGTEYLLTYNLDIEKANKTPKYYQKFAIIKSKDEGTINAKTAEFKSQLLEAGDKVLNESYFLTLEPQAAMVVIDYKTGHVKGIAGGRGTKSVSRGLNRATQSPRQAGSTFKVLAAFVPAIDMKIKTAASVQDDVPYYLTNFGNKQIKNWYSGYRGLSTLREGTRDSMNIVAVKTIMDVGLDNAFNYLKKFGFTTLVESRNVNGQVFTDKTPSAALGGLTDGVTVLELTSAYGAIANGGVLNKPIFYTKVTNINGEVLLTKTTTSSKVIDPGTAYIATTMMRDVITSGTGGSANIPGQYVAGKTGTTSDSKDLTFAGYTPYYVAGIWVGHDTPKAMGGDQSIHTKAWAQVMRKIHQGLPYKDFAKPSNVTTAYVCAESGKLAVGGLCDADPRGNRAYTEYFLTGTAPTTTCDVHVKADVVSADGKYYLTNASTPANIIPQSKVFIKRPATSGSYYNGQLGGSVADSIYEVPTEYFNPFGFENIDPENLAPTDNESGDGDDDNEMQETSSQVKPKSDSGQDSKRDNRQDSFIPIDESVD